MHTPEQKEQQFDRNVGGLFRVCFRCTCTQAVSMLTSDFLSLFLSRMYLAHDELESNIFSVTLILMSTWTYMT